MTQMEIQNHPYYQKLIAHLNSMVPQLMRMGRISQQEGQLMVTMMRNIGPGTVNFIQSLCARYPNGLSEQAMQQEISSTFLPQIIQSIRQRMGGGMMNTGGLFNPTFGTMGAMPQPMMGGMFTGGNTAFTGGCMPSGGATDLFGGPAKPQTPIVQPQPAPVQQPTSVKPQMNTSWTAPTLMQDDVCKTAFKIANCAEIRCNRFTTSDGKTCRRLVISDPRLKYLNAQEALFAYKPFLNTFRDDHRFVTVVFKQLKLLEIDQSEFEKMAVEIANNVATAGTNVVDKLRIIIETMRHHYSMACVEEYQRMFMDELDEHVCAGELTVKNNPKMIFNKFGKFQDIIDILTKNIDKDVANGLDAINGFFAKFNDLLEDVINDIAVQLPKRILDPVKMPTLTEAYARVLPTIWSDDCGRSYRGTDDLIGMLVTSRMSMSNGSVPDSAKAAENNLTSKLKELAKKFTVVWVWRAVSWTNYPASSTIGYSGNGECEPTVFSPKSPKTDIEYFVAEVTSAMETAKDTAKHRTPRSMLVEFEEQIFSFNYSLMIDGNIWLGTSKYWK